MVQLAGSLDGGGAGVATPDLQKNGSAAAAAAYIKSSDSYSITIENLPVKIFGSYNFIFQYSYLDDSQPTPIDGPFSATYSIPVNVPDLSVAPTNLVGTGGYNSYQLKWDTPTFASYGDTVVYESNSALSAPSAKVVYIGTANQCTILTSDSLAKYVYVVHRDMFLDANKKGTPYGPITILEPVSVDTTGPSNVTSVTASGGVETGGISGFNGFLDISWPAVTGNGIRGYRIRYKATGSTNYSYADSPGTGTAYRLTGLGVGLTYEIAVATYDEYNNTSTSYVAATNVAISGTPYIASTVDVTGFFRAKANSGDADSTAFKFGYGVDTGKRGLVFTPDNYWYIDSSQGASLKVGGPDNHITWNGASLVVTGDIQAKKGTFSGNINLASGASIYSGAITGNTSTASSNTGGSLSGDGYILSSTGLIVRKTVAGVVNTVQLSTLDGSITANAGNIAGWALSANSLSNNNIVLDSAGSIIVGASNSNNTIRLSSGDIASNDGNIYRLWVGTQVASSVTPLRITREGLLYATGAVITGNSTFNGSITSGSTITGANITMTGTVSGYGLASAKLLFQDSNYAISAGSSSFTYPGTSGSYDSEGDWISATDSQTITNNDIRFTDATLAGAIPSSGFYYGELWLGSGTNSGSTDLWANYPGGYIGISVVADSTDKNIMIFGDSSAGFTTLHRSSTTDDTKQSPAFLQVDSSGRLSRGRAILTGGSSAPSTTLGLTGDLYFSTAT